MNGFGLRVSKGFSIAGVFAAALFVAAPAHASVGSQLDDLSKGVVDISHDVVSFFGFGPDQANNPTDPQPAQPPPDEGRSAASGAPPSGQASPSGEAFMGGQ